MLHLHSGESRPVRRSRRHRVRSPSAWAGAEKAGADDYGDPAAKWVPGSPKEQQWGYNKTGFPHETPSWDLRPGHSRTKGVDQELATRRLRQDLIGYPDHHRGFVGLAWWPRTCLPGLHHWRLFTEVTLVMLSAQNIMKSLFPSFLSTHNTSSGPKPQDARDGSAIEGLPAFVKKQSIMKHLRGWHRGHQSSLELF